MLDAHALFSPKMNSTQQLKKSTMGAVGGHMLIVVCVVRHSHENDE